MFSTSKDPTILVFTFVTVLKGGLYPKPGKCGVLFKIHSRFLTPNLNLP